jgi:hypothetical protein
MSTVAERVGKSLSEWHAKAARCPEEKPKDKRHYLSLGSRKKSLGGGFESLSGVVSDHRGSNS